jgi:hypothetical protein
MCVINITFCREQYTNITFYLEYLPPSTRKQHGAQHLSRRIGHLIPKDVSVSLTAALTGNLEASDWTLILEVLGAVKRGLPDAGARAPSEVHVVCGGRYLSARFQVNRGGKILLAWCPPAGGDVVDLGLEAQLRIF